MQGNEPEEQTPGQVAGVSYGFDLANDRPLVDRTKQPEANGGKLCNENFQD